MNIGLLLRRGSGRASVIRFLMASWDAVGPVDDTHDDHFITLLLLFGLVTVHPGPAIVMVTQSALFTPLPL